MSHISIQQAMHKAVGEHRAGRLAAAEGIYREVLAVVPGHADALYLLGVAQGQRGMNEAAIQLIGAAIAVRPGVADYHCHLGMVLDSAGRLDEAAAELRLALTLNPEHCESHNRMGMLLAKRGEMDAAMGHYQRAMAINPRQADAWNNLGTAWKAKGDLEEAMGCYRRALGVDEKHALSHNNLGAALCDAGRWDEAIGCCQRAAALNPGLAEAHVNEGNAWRAKGEADVAIVCFERALAKRPGWVEAYSGLGHALADKGEWDGAMLWYRKALVIVPNSAALHNSMGSVLLAKRQVEEAIGWLEKGVGLDAGYAEAQNNLGQAWWLKGDLDRALACCLRAVEMKPGLAAGWQNLGNIWKDRGQMEEAVAANRRGLALRPDDVGLHDNLLYALLFDAASDRASLLEEAKGWNRRFAVPLKGKIAPHGNERSGERRLRIGYVSPNFFTHPVARFMLPLLRGHDRRNFEVFCYSDGAIVDGMTGRVKAQVDIWRDIQRQSPDAVAARIRADGIDILVDLAMHMAENRMLLFARQPAPVQVSYLAYAGGTGVDAIGYRLSDPYLDPDPAEDRFYLEKTVRLPRTYWCYEAPVEAPAVGELPAVESGRITFGCLNNFSKVSAAALEAWGELLGRVAESRLVLFALPGSHRGRVEEILGRHGVDAERVEWVGFMSQADYFQMYRRMDIALDPFPYGGGTTTCDALYMGVPVVTLAGRTAVGRAGVSLLTNVGLPELIGQSTDDYVRIAAELAGDVGRLKELRRGLRGRMEESPLMDGPAFARDVEAAFRGMWREYLSGAPRV